MQAMKPEPEHLTVIVDSREQHPLKLGMPCKRGTLSPGTLKGLEDVLCAEHLEALKTQTRIH